MPTFDQAFVLRLLQSLLVIAVAVGLFLGLRGRILRFAQWAGLPRLAFTPVQLILRYSILAIGTTLVLGLWGFPIGTLLAFFGTMLGLVAIGFVAVWSVLSNFLCTFVLVMFKPFSVGDELELPAENIRGRVVDLSLIFTTLEITPEETVLIPNNTYFQRVFKRRAGRCTTGLAERLRQPSPDAHAGLVPPAAGESRP